MATTTRPGTEDLTAEIADPRVDDPTVVDTSVATPPPPDLDAPTDDEVEPERSPIRMAVAVAFPTTAAAVMVGGVFIGASGRVYAGVAGLLGIGLAVVARRLRKPALLNAVIVIGLFAIGLLMLVPTGLGNVVEVRERVSEAATSGDLLRPPVPFDTGWRAISGWLMGIIGFVATWLAIVVRRPALGLLVPMPIAAFAGISVPDDAQVPSGLAVLVLFAIGLGLLSSEQSVGEGDERPPIGYEVRKALKALPVIAAVTVVLGLLAQTDFLFPPPVIDPAEEPQKPNTVPLSEVEDRVLFTVDSTVSGPWRIGTLDTYDPDDGFWKLPPFSQSELQEVPRDGFVDRTLPPEVNATFTIAGFGGTVLPGLPNTVGIIADGPQLAYDARSGNIRLEQGQIEPGLTYTVAAAGLPTVQELIQSTRPVPDAYQRFLVVPDAPPAAAALIADARAQFDSRWERFDFLRTYVLDNVVASGPGSPVAVTAERVQEILTELEASPYEIVAIQGLFARWVGVPSRLGYGFDGGELINEVLEVRPRNGATFPEVYFEGFGWLPVIGTPKQAEPSVGTDPSDQRVDPNVIPSNDIAVQLFLPVIVEPPSVFGQQVLRAALLVAAALALAALLYALWPAARKAWIRSRRRSAALAAGPRARIALAYAEWRDHAADYGFASESDTPLMFLDKFIPDDEHDELAWLVTRSLWGDLQPQVDDRMAASAEELSRALRRRLSAAQPATMRAVAAVSRISLRRPFAPETDLTSRGRKRADEVPARPRRKERNRAAAATS